MVEIVTRFSYKITILNISRIEKGKIYSFDFGVSLALRTSHRVNGILYDQKI